MERTWSTMASMVPSSSTRSSFAARRDTCRSRLAISRSRSLVDATGWRAALESLAFTSSVSRSMKPSVKSVAMTAPSTALLRSIASWTAPSSSPSLGRSA